MTLSEWIENYCEENNIELPSGIPDEKTALQFLSVNGSGGGGGGESGLMIATYVPVDSRINLNKSFNEVAAIMASGAVPYIVIDNSISGYINIPEGTIVPFTIFDDSEGITGAAFYDGGYNAIVFEISGGLDGTLFFYVD